MNGGLKQQATELDRSTPIRQEGLAAVVRYPGIDEGEFNGTIQGAVCTLYRSISSGIIEGIPFRSSFPRCSLPIL